MVGIFPASRAFRLRVIGPVPHYWGVLGLDRSTVRFAGPDPFGTAKARTALRAFALLTARRPLRRAASSRVEPEAGRRLLVVFDVDAEAVPQALEQARVDLAHP